jgi:hypothetical protein
MSDYGLNKAMVIVIGLMIVTFGSTALAVSQHQQSGAFATPTSSREWYQWSDVTYAGTHLPSVELNPDSVTHWVTYPAPSTAVEVSNPVPEWQPTAQAPGLSTLAPWQTPYPTLTCVTNCE